MSNSNPNWTLIFGANKYKKMLQKNLISKKKSSFYAFSCKCTERKGHKVQKNFKIQVRKKFDLFFQILFRSSEFDQSLVWILENITNFNNCISKIFCIIYYTRTNNTHYLYRIEMKLYRMYIFQPNIQQLKWS